MDWRSLLRNPWVLGGLGVAVVAGGVVWYRRRAAGGASSSTGAQASPGYAGGIGTFDSTGTDVAGWLGNYSGGLQNQLDQYQQQLTDALTGAGLIPHEGSSAPAVTLPATHPVVNGGSGRRPTRWGG